MGNFRGGSKGFGGGRGGFGGGNRGGFERRDGGGERRSFERRDSERPQMFSAVCDNCGNECQVPFRPTQGKPVFCDDCFRNRDHGHDDFQRPEKRFDERRFNDREQKPQGHDTNHKVLEQISALNNKLDRILTLLAVQVTKKTSIQTDSKEVTKVAAEEKPVKRSSKSEGKVKKTKKVVEKKGKGKE